MIQNNIHPLIGLCEQASALKRIYGADKVVIAVMTHQTKSIETIEMGVSDDLDPDSVRHVLNAAIWKSFCIQNGKEG